MSFWNPLTWFPRLRARVQEPAPLGVEAKPVELNPIANQALLRHATRLACLYRVVREGETSQSYRDEIERRKGEIMARGHKAPMDEEAALALLKQIGGE